MSFDMLISGDWLLYKSALLFINVIAELRLKTNDLRRELDFEDPRYDHALPYYCQPIPFACPYGACKPRHCADFKLSIPQSFIHCENGRWTLEYELDIVDQWCRESRRCGEVVKHDWELGDKNMNHNRLFDEAVWKVHNPVSFTRCMLTIQNSG